MAETGRAPGFAEKLQPHASTNRDTPTPFPKTRYTRDIMTKVGQPGQAAGGLDFRSVGAAIGRFERKLKRDKHARKLVENAIQ